MSYACVSKGMDRFRTALADAGAGRGCRVAIIHRDPARMAFLLLAAASGATAVPMGSGLSAAEYAAQLSERGATVLLLPAGELPEARTAADQLSLPVLEMAWPGSALTIDFQIDGRASQTAVAASDAVPEDIAFVLATSGTSSRSKIIPITHRLNLSRIATRQVCEHISAQDHCIILNQIYLHGGVTTIGVSLLSGGSIVFLSHFQADRFFRLVRAQRPTWFHGSFTFVKSIIQYAKANPDLDITGIFRFLRPTSGGVDPVDSAAIEDIFGAPVIEMYSSTECGHVAVNPFPPEVRKHGTVGKPAHCEIAFLSDGKVSFGPGEAGEVLVKGKNVFSGYENDERANQDAFVNGWYRTGDIGVLDEDGFLALRGRVTETINRGGEKIMPAEIDAALLLHPDIADAACFAIPHATLGEIVGAAIVVRTGARLDGRAVNLFLKSRLSAAKIPRDYLALDELPKTPIGKVQRRRLAEMYAEKRASAGKRQAS